MSLVNYSPFPSQRAIASATKAADLAKLAFSDDFIKSNRRLRGTCGSGTGLHWITVAVVLDVSLLALWHTPPTPLPLLSPSVARTTRSHSIPFIIIRGHELGSERNTKILGTLTTITFECSRYRWPVNSIMNTVEVPAGWQNCPEALACHFCHFSLPSGSPNIDHGVREDFNVTIYNVLPNNVTLAKSSYNL